MAAIPKGPTGKPKRIGLAQMRERPTLTTHYSLLTTHYSLLTTYYSLLTTHYSLLTTHDSLLTTHDSRLTTHYSRLTTDARAADDRRAGPAHLQHGGGRRRPLTTAACDGLRRERRRALAGR
eukprot:scaffold4342_cov50-Phaeocystis_antarctica.AAC.1